MWKSCRIPFNSFNPKQPSFPRDPRTLHALACGDARRSGKEAGEARFEQNRARTAVYWTECGQAAPGGAGAAGESFIAAGDPARGRPVTTARGLWLQPIGQAGAAKGAARLGASRLIRTTCLQWRRAGGRVAGPAAGGRR